MSGSFASFESSVGYNCSYFLRPSDVDPHLPTPEPAFAPHGAELDAAFYDLSKPSLPLAIDIPPPRGEVADSPSSSSFYSVSPVELAFAPIKTPALPFAFGYTPSTPEHDDADEADFLHGAQHTTFFGADGAAHPAPYLAARSQELFRSKMRGRKSKQADEARDGPRPHLCNICHAAFARSHDRDRHRRSHTGETPYSCRACGHGFKRPDARKRHWEKYPACYQRDWELVKYTPEGARRKARAKPRRKGSAGPLGVAAAPSAPGAVPAWVTSPI